MVPWLVATIWVVVDELPLISCANTVPLTASKESNSDFIRNSCCIIFPDLVAGEMMNLEKGSLGATCRKQ